jgi:hypothetical protein
MAHIKLSDADEAFLQTPADGVLVFAGSSGTESFIERAYDSTVRLIVKAVGVATADDGVLAVTLELGDAKASGQDGPHPNESTLRASQSAQVVLKAGQRLVFRAYPTATNAMVLRTMVCTADMSDPRLQPRDPAPAAETHGSDRRRGEATISANPT